MRKANSRCRQREVERRHRFWIKNYQDHKWHYVETNGSETKVVRVIKKGKGF